MTTQTLMHKHALICHPETPSRRARGIQVDLSKTRDGAIAITYWLDAELSLLSIPEPCTPRRAEKLWLHTCFEAFVAVKGRPEYREYNFSPSGEWAAYTFIDYRDGGLPAQNVDPQILVHRGLQELELQAVIGRSCLPQPQAGADWLVGLSAVIEEDHGSLSFWALGHRSNRPDFHHRDGFVLSFDPDVDAAGDPSYTVTR